MTNQETRFLERLGITPGPWEVTCFNDIIASDMSGLITNVESDRPIPEDKSNCIFMSKAPEMFLSLWNNCLQILRVVELHGCGDLEKILMPMVFDNQEKLESATGKTFDHLLEIWEACE